MQKIISISSKNNLNIFLFYSLLITYLLTPWSRVLLEKLIGSAASQEIPHILTHFQIQCT